MSTSALQRLREARPNASITILSHEKLAGLWKHQPFVDDVMFFTSAESPLQIGRRLRWGNFDAGLLFPNSPRSALELWFGRVPVRIGYSRAWRNLFLTRPIPPRAEEVRMHKRTAPEIKRRIAAGTPAQRFESSAHHLHQYLHLVAEAFGGNPLPLKPGIVVTQTQIDEFRKRFNLTDLSVPICGVNPGAEYGPAKRWPKESYVSAAVELFQTTGCSFFIFGGPGDVPLSTEIADSIARTVPKVEILNLAGRTSLNELSAALRLCRVVLTNDSGPMHLASAIGTAVVVPFGSTSADLTGPGLPGEPSEGALTTNVSCSPCFLRDCPVDFRCMKEIAVSQVVNAALRAF